MQLALSLAVLAAAPPLGMAADRMRHRVAQGVLVLLVLLVLASVLPEAFHELGWVALALAVAGWAAPTLVERFRHAHGVHALPRGLVAAGLILHALMDGAAIATESVSLGWAVILHRIPAATATWMVLQPCWGNQRTVAVLGATAVTTVMGWAGGQALAHAHHGPWVSGFIALVAGSLLHLATHRLDHDHDH